MKKGNVLIIAMIFISICIVIMLFIATIFMSHVNSILYNVKLEMYSINKTAIIAVNKNKTSIDDFSYNKKAFRDYFEKSLKSNFKLDHELKSKDGLIEYINIDEYDILDKNKKDNFTNKRCDDRIIHTVIELKVKPIIMRSLFDKIFTFKIHEDVNLNTAY